MATKPYSVRAGDAGPGPCPMTGNPELERYVQAELSRLYGMVALGMVQGLEMAVLGVEPPNVLDGMVRFFRENVVGPQRGLYVYSEENWKFIK